MKMIIIIIIMIIFITIIIILKVGSCMAIISVSCDTHGAPQVLPRL